MLGVTVTIRPARGVPKSRAILRLVSQDQHEKQNNNNNNTFPSGSSSKNGDTGLDGRLSSWRCNSSGGAVQIL